MVDAKTKLVQHKLRQTIYDEASSFISVQKQKTMPIPDKATIERAKQFYQKIEKTYDDRIFNGVPRLGLVALAKWLCIVYSKPETTKLSLEWSLRFFRNLGFAITIQDKLLTIDRKNAHLDSNAIDAAVFAAHASFIQGNGIIGAQFEQFARDLYRLFNGDLRGYELRYGLRRG